MSTNLNQSHRTGDIFEELFDYQLDVYHFLRFCQFVFTMFSIYMFFSECYKLYEWATTTMPKIKAPIDNEWQIKLQHSDLACPICL